MDVAPNHSLDFAQAASEISTRFGTQVLLSLGGNGAVAVNGQEVFIVKNPSVAAKSAVGSGYFMLAELTYGFLHGFSFGEAVIHGVAAGTANTLTIGARQFKIEDFEQLRNQVNILKM